MKIRVASQLASKCSRAVWLAPLVIVTLLGCDRIIGLDEYTVAKHAAGASSMGGAGKGGAGKGGGTGVSGGASGASGESGESGAGAEGGEAGAGSPAPVVGCDGETAFEPNAQIIRSCILRAGCDPSFAPVRTISTCVTYNTQAGLVGERCNLESTSCADFEACEHVGIAHEDLCGGTKTTGTRCQGDLAINCGNYAGDDRFFDCAGLGGTCGTFKSGDKLFADCKLDIAPDSCTGKPSTDEKAFCHAGDGTTDDSRYYCWDGQAFGASCSSVASCIDTPSDGSSDPSAVGNANCFFNTDSCAGADRVSCKSGVATVCSSGSKFEYNCGSVGLSCGIAGKNEYCLAPGCDAADVDVACQESCSNDGSSLTFCYGGAHYTVACKDYGFTQCASGTDPDSGRAFAACRF